MTKVKKSAKKNIIPPKPHHPSREKLFHCIFLFLLSVVIYINTLHYGFVLDDSLFVTGNAFTLKGTDGLKDIWTHDAFVGAHGREFDLEGGRYRPLSISLFALSVEFFGMNPLPMHILNILFYGITAILMYLFLCKLISSKNLFIPLVATSLFVVHPIHTEVVANIKSLDEILSMVFLLLSLILILGDGLMYSIAAAFCFLLSLLSKESSVTALGFIPFMLFFFRKIKGKGIFIKMVPFILITVFYLILRTSVTGAFTARVAKNVMDSPYLFAGFWEKYATIVMVCGKYLLMQICPWPLSYDYSYNAIPLTSWKDIRAIVSLLSFIVIGIICIRIFFRALRKKTSGSQHILSFGILVFLLALSIVSNLFFNIGAPMGERFSYLPSLGSVITVSGILAMLFKEKQEVPLAYKPVWVIPVLLIIITGAYVTMHRNRAWESNFKLFETDIKTVPNSARARMFYGIELLNLFYKNNNPETLDSAITELEQSCRINPKFYHAYYNLGLAWMAKHDYKSALKSLETVLKIEPRHINGNYYYGLTLAKGFGQYEKGIEYMKNSISKGFKGEDAYENIGLCYGMLGKYQEALDALLKEFADYPNDAALNLNIGVTYDKLQQPEKAKYYYDRATELNPELLKKAGNP
jgi:Tfp pilus assembly protein PilF